MRCLIFLKSRAIVHLDNILPLILELNKLGFISRPLFVIDNKFYEDYKKNIVICDCINSMNGSFVSINKYKNKFLNKLSNIFILRYFFLYRLISIESSYGFPKSSKILSFLTRFNQRFWKGKIILSSINNLPYDVLKPVDQRKQKKSSVSEVRNYDCVLLGYTREQHEDLYNNYKYINCNKLIQVGYTRGYISWHNFLEENSNKYFPKEMRNPYILYTLGTFGKGGMGDFAYKNPPYSEIFKKSLNVLKNYNDNILTVFKPHPTTDIEELHEILDSVGYKNYIISYLHPILLMKRAKFLQCFGSSTLMADAYYHGCTVIEFSYYHPDTLNLTGGKASYHGVIDFFINQNEDQLKSVIDKILFQRIKMERNKVRIKKMFPILHPHEIKEKFAFLNE